MLQPALKRVYGPLAIQKIGRYAQEQEEDRIEASGSASVALRLVLSELKHHLGKDSDICYPFRKKKGERDAKAHELSLLRSIHGEETYQENRTWLCNLLLLSMPTDFQ